MNINWKQSSISLNKFYDNSKKYSKGLKYLNPFLHYLLNEGIPGVLCLIDICICVVNVLQKCTCFCQLVYDND